jgi:hypothetical protein
MSRNNTHYWDLCTETRVWEPIGEDGYCGRHKPGTYGNRNGDRRSCFSPREYETRRGLYRRKERYPFGNHYFYPPPMDMKRLWQRRLRAMYREELRARPYDPEMPDGGKLLAGWYQNWN